MLKLSSTLFLIFFSLQTNAQAQQINFELGQQATCEIKKILNYQNGITEFSESLIEFQLKNQNFYKVCMKKVNRHSYCISAGRGAIDCLENTSKTEEECHSAQPGFLSCLNDNQAEDNCIFASASYRRCIRYESSAACLLVTDGYSDCLQVSGYGSARCNGTASDYKECILSGYSHGQCLNSFGGMMSCLEAGLSPSLCQMAITETQMECYHQLHDLQTCRFPNHTLLHI